MLCTNAINTSGKYAERDRKKFKTQSPRQTTDSLHSQVSVTAAYSTNICKPMNKMSLNS